jgi:hypothetical protein
MKILDAAHLLAVPPPRVIWAAEHFLPMSTVGDISGPPGERKKCTCPGPCQHHCQRLGGISKANEMPHSGWSPYSPAIFEMSQDGGMNLLKIEGDLANVATQLPHKQVQPDLLSNGERHAPAWL